MHEKWIVKTTGGMYVNKVTLEDYYSPLNRINLIDCRKSAQYFHTKHAALDIAVRIGGVVERV